MTAIADNSRGEELVQAFRVFSRTARELEDAYDRLRSKGEELECELKDVNRELRGKVEALDDLSCYLEGVLEALPTGVLALGRDGRVGFVNREAERILGVSRASLLGRDRNDLVGDRASLLLARDGSSESPLAERTVVTPTGVERRVEAGLSVIRNERGEVQGAVEILHDRTEVARLRDRVARLDELAALGEMAAAMAHEIRNPLYGSAGFADLLGKELTSRGHEDLQNYVVRIKRGIERVDAIIDNVLSGSRPDRGAGESVGVLHLLGEVIESLRDRYPAHAVQLLTEGGAELFVAGDPIKLGRVIENLLRNAVEAMDDGGPITVSARRGDGTVDLEVADRGPGLLPEVRGRIFRPFFTTKETGTGLGLFLAQKIVETCGGKLDLLDREGGGTTARVTLPLEQREAALCRSERREHS